MKNRIIYLLSITVVILLAVIFLPVIAGKSLFNLNSLKSAISNQQQDPLPEFSSIGPSKPATVYRWKEHDNTWHFSSTPPPAGTRYETVIIDADHTHAVLSDPPTPEVKTVQAKTAPADTTSIPSLYSPAEIARILKEAKEAQKKMQEHQKELDAVLNGAQS